MSRMMRWTVAGALAALSAAAGAQTFDLALTGASSATLTTSATIETSGVLIGDYDAETNPTGTQTRPGLFGGSGNNPINASVDLMIDGGGTTQPVGGMQMAVDFETGSASVSGLSLDLLNEEVLAADLNASLLLNTFHTVNPTMIYPGGIEIPLPLGELGSLQIASLVQSDAAVGVVTATGDPSVFDVVIAVPVELSMQVEVGGLGGEPTVTPVGPLPALLPLTGQITISGGTLTLSATLGPLEDSQEIPIGPLELPQVPLELPTLGSETAGVLLTLSAETLLIDTLIDISIVAEGSAADCTADWNDDGVLDFFDVAGFLQSFSSMDESADLNNDELFDFFDVLDFLSRFSAGCP